MEMEQPRIPPSVPVTTDASGSSDPKQTFESLRGRLNQLLDEVAKGTPAGAKMLAAVRCGGGCHQGVID